MSKAMLDQHLLWTIRGPSGLPMPRRFPETTQSCLNQHTPKSLPFFGKPGDDLFYSPEGKSSGTWAVRKTSPCSGWKPTTCRSHKTCEAR
jgi:hypothetical protein